MSIDIGLRNLAMCIMDSTDTQDLSTYSIHLWDVYNTLDSDDYLCQAIQKNGKICNKKCSFKYKEKQENQEEEKEVFTCKTHFPKDITIQKKNKFKKKSVDNYLLQDIAKIVLEKVQTIYDENISLFNQLKSIVIELQPKINQKMKFVSHIIYGKLTELLKNQDTTIRFVRASQKLRAYTGPFIECKLKGKYAQRKWLSIEYTKWFLENSFNTEEKEKWFHYFNDKKVKSDMGDCFLYCINAIHGIPKKQKYQKNGKCIK